MSRCIVFLVLLLLSVGATAGQTILVFGDSLSAGYGLKYGEAWPTLLAERLKRTHPAHSVVNASVSGETSAGGRSRLPAALRQHQPGVMILALGANDGLRGLPVEVLRDNLKAMIATARKSGAKVLLAGMEMPPNYGPDYVGKFRSAFAEVARSEKVAYVPFLLDGFAHQRDLFQADTIHPTAAAQPLIVDNVWPALKPLLGK